MSFRNRTCAHLAQYKTNVLGVKDHGLFRYRGRDVAKTHILPIASHRLNVIEAYRAQFFSSAYSNIKLHKFFHHLNSSQALCINLFYPLIAEHQLRLFLQFLGISPGAEQSALFEKESDIEMALRRTSFDFYVQVAAIKSVFVEVKYTEYGFGQAKNDDEHRTKFHKTYLPLVESSPFLESVCREEAFFLDHYQVLRNLVHISDTSNVALLFPSANTTVAKEAMYARDHLLTDSGRARLTIVLLHEFVSFLEDRCVGSRLDGYYQAFRAKYLPISIEAQQGVQPAGSASGL